MFGAAFFLYQGLQFRWLPWLQSPHHNLLIALCSCASIYALVQFSRNFLAIPDHIPGYDRWMARLGRFFGGLCGLLALYMVAIAVRRELWSNFPTFYLTVFKALALATAAGYAVISIVAAAALRSGCRQARFYLLGFGAIYLFLIPVLVSQARGTSAVSDIYWVQIGSCLEMLLFAFALADKLRDLRAQKNAAEEKALAETAERTRLERAHEEILRQRDRLEELDRQKSEFLGIAAHDLKNPLNAVQGIAVLLSADERLPASQRMRPEEREEFLSDVEDCSHQMLAIIDSLLETDALEGGRLKLAREPHALSDLVERAWRGLARTAEAKRITVSIRVPLHLRVMVDRDRFLRVLENLLSNAIKYSPPGGAILLQAVEGELPGRIVMALQDSGPGFSAADMPQLFGRYRKLSARPTAGESSSGLGLYIVYRLLELQGGTIAVISPPGQSAIFRIEVPSA
jgi:signal transduction histidine kinase